MGGLERDLSSFIFPIKENLLTLAWGKWFICVDKAAERYMKRWFVKSIEIRAKRRVQKAAEQYMKRWFALNKKNIYQHYERLRYNLSGVLRCRKAQCRGNANRGAALKEA